MADKDLKFAIQSSIKAFNNGDISKNALALFSTLGYNTNPQGSFTQKTYQTFKDSFLDGETTRFEDKAMVNEWKSVDLLFQLTKDEILQQQSLFNTKRVDQTIIESYLFFAIELAKAEYTRTALAQITREINKVFSMPVMLLFKHGQRITISVINRRIHKIDERKDVLEKVTLIKDISIENPHRAHIEILFDLSFNELLHIYKFTNFIELHNAWQKTLDTKELNKRFFQELANWYFWAMENVSFPDDIEKNEEIRNATNLIRLITRVIFIWFVKEKNLVPEILFDRNQLGNLLKDFNNNQKSHSYYHAILQNLFFGTLNQKMDERGFATYGSFEENKKNYGIKNLYRYSDQFAITKEEAIELFKDIPFLNGGLFDCLDKDNENGKVLYSDGFSRNPKKQAIVPDFLFFNNEHEYDLNKIYNTKNKTYKVKGLFDILTSYKFTVTENTPIEEDVALDPELLGRVFENLLASYNPETRTTARKQTGSFYTPREIVNYMVDESLKAYLKQKLEDEAGMDAEDAEVGLEFLIGYYDKENLFDEKQTAVLINAIDTCKILDPACGSGAFPMGILHKLVHILNKLDPNNEKWREVQRQKAIKETEDVFKIVNKQEREDRLIEINDVFENNSDDYGRKLYLIENCIYGVDIQPIAAQISKLRFFISLIVDQKTDKTKDNFGIRPLPNLETKFVAANTLIGIEKPKQQLNIFDNKTVNELEEKLKAIRHRMFGAKTPAIKRKLREEDQALRGKMRDLLIANGWGNETARQLAGWDPYDQNASSPFFDPEWMFGVREGFDVVIGNPPYLESRHPSFRADLKELYQISCKNRWGNDANLITKGADLLIYFFEASVSFIEKTGNVVLITQNAWLDTEYGIKAQSFLTKHTNVVSVIDSKYRYFPAGEGPNINTVITLFIGKEANPFNLIRFYTLKENIADISFDLNNNVNAENDKYKVNVFSYSDKIITKYKWGILHNSDSFILDIINMLERKATTVDKIPSKSLFSFGQGLNISKSFFVPIEILLKHNIDLANCFPILYLGSPFQVKHTDWYLVRKNLIGKTTAKNLHADGFSIFDENSTRKKPPILIMPRGISRHFCSLNNISAYSLSGVDVYATDTENIEKETLNLWCFFNSSLFWLLREISGRKNLGGGLLKSEAADLNSFPVYLSLDCNKEELTRLLDRDAMDTLDEILSTEHKMIDEIIFDYLEFNENYRERCIEYLRNAIIFRNTRSVT